MNANANPIHSFISTVSLKTNKPSDVVAIKIPILTIGEARDKLIPVSKSFRKERVPIPKQTPASAAYTNPFEVINNFLTGKLKKSKTARAGSIETADIIIIPKKSLTLPAIRFIK